MGLLCKIRGVNEAWCLGGGHRPCQGPSSGGHPCPCALLPQAAQQLLLLQRGCEPAPHQHRRAAEARAHGGYLEARGGGQGSDGAGEDSGQVAVCLWELGPGWGAVVILTHIFLPRRLERYCFKHWKRGWRAKVTCHRSRLVSSRAGV